MFTSMKFPNKAVQQFHFTRCSSAIVPLRGSALLPLASCLLPHSRPAKRTRTYADWAIWGISLPDRVVRLVVALWRSLSNANYQTNPFGSVTSHARPSPSLCPARAHALGAWTPRPNPTPGHRVTLSVASFPSRDWEEFASASGDRACRRGKPACRPCVPAAVTVAPEATYGEQALAPAKSGPALHTGTQHAASSGSQRRRGRLDYAQIRRGEV